MSGASLYDVDILVVVFICLFFVLFCYLHVETTITAKHLAIVQTITLQLKTKYMWYISFVLLIILLFVEQHYLLNFACSIVAVSWALFEGKSMSWRILA